jgi:hypothetical protein
MLRPLLPALLVLSLPACQLLTGSDEAPELRATDSSFLAGDTVRAELVNRSSERLGFGGCTLALQRHGSDSWETVVPPAQLCAAILFVIGPGSRAERKLAVPSTVPEGEYRLRDAVMPGTSLPELEIFSQPFAIVRSR